MPRTLWAAIILACLLPFAACAGVSVGKSSTTVGPVATVTVSPASAILVPAQTQQFTATAADANGNLISGLTFTWASDTTSVATVNAGGLATAISNGTAHITATAPNGISGSAPLTVESSPPVIASIAVAPPSALLSPAQTQQFTASAFDGSGNLISGVTFTWSSDTTSVASVNASGLSTAISNGTAHIIATAPNGVSGSAALTVQSSPPVLASVTVSPAAVLLIPAQTQQFTATAFDGSGNLISGVTFTWSSDTTSVATVNATGLGTAISSGTAHIIATAPNGIFGSATITVPLSPPVVASVTVSPATVLLIPAQTQQFTAAAFDANGNLISGLAFTWSSNTPSVATVNATGLGTAISSGTAHITATAPTGVSGSVTLTVPTSPPVVASVTVSPAAVLLSPTQTQQFTAAAFDANGNLISGLTFTWSSNTPSVATVNATGLATAISTGTAHIIATAPNGVSGSAALTVPTSPPVVASITVSPAAVLLIPAQPQQFTAAAFDANGNLITGLTFTWSSNTTSVATVNATGLGTAIGNGTAHIIATASNGISGSSALTVQSAPPVVASVTVSPASVLLTPAQTQQFTATAFDANGNLVSGLTFTWSSNTPPVATVNATGLGTAISSGTAHITATAPNGISGSATLTVPASPPVVASVTVSPASVLLSPAQTQQFTAAAFDANGNLISGLTFTWSSNTPSVATVNATGLGTAISSGTAHITATAPNGIFGSATLTVPVSPPVVASVTVSPAAVLLGPAQTQQFTATASAANGSLISGVTFTWSSNTTSVATVNTSGLATAIGNGTSSITATAPNAVSGSAAMTVLGPVVSSNLFGADFNDIPPAVWPATDSNANTASITGFRVWDDGQKINELQNSDGSYNWTRLDDLIKTLAPGQDMHVLYSFGGTPLWWTVCNGQPDPGPCFPGPTTYTMTATGAVASGHLNELTSTGSPFFAANVGSIFEIPGAGPAGASLTATVTSYVSANEVMFSPAASQAVSAVTVTSGYGGGTQCAITYNASNDASCLPPDDISSEGTGTDAQVQSFVSAVAQRYGTGIAYWEISNEADSANFWCLNSSVSACGGSAASLARLVRIGWDSRQILLCANPDIKIVSPSGHVGSMTTWFEAYSNTTIDAPAGSIGGCSWPAQAVTGLMTYDIVNEHMRGTSANNHDPTQVIPAYNAAVTAMSDLGIADYPLWNGEFGYVSPQAANADIAAAYVGIEYALMASFSKPIISQSYWYLWDDSYEPLQGTEAGTAFDVLYSWEVGNTPGPCIITGTVYQCNITSPAGKLSQIIFDSSQNCNSGCTTSTQTTTFDHYIDLGGVSHAISGTTVEVSLKPELLTLN